MVIVSSAPATRLRPSFELEEAELLLGHGPVAGVDEAGRGPWAGPVVAAAVILDPTRIPAGLDDSKAMDEGARERAFAAIMATARVGVGVGDVARIDRDNILQATLHAMAEAIAALGVAPGLALIDGNKVPRCGCPARAIVKGDARCLSIAAASIIAKVTRDRIMVGLAGEHPGFGFERHKGYGVPEHKAALARLGVTQIHRRSFKPVQLALELCVVGAGSSLVDAADTQQVFPQRTAEIPVGDHVIGDDQAE
jgi:ribonuclease HII